MIRAITIVLVVWFGLVLGGGIGWILNIVQVVHATSAPVTGLFILKCVGIPLAPLGAVLGWIGIF